MGTSYNTLIFYGVDLGDLADPDTYESWAPAWMRGPGGPIDEWDPDDHLARKLGWQEVPWPGGSVDIFSPEYEEWARSRTEAARLVKEADYGCTLDSYGHAEGDLTLLVQVDASVIKGGVWTCVRLDGVAVQQWRPDWNERLERYLDALEIPAERRPEPGWHLTGWVG